MTMTYGQIESSLQAAIVAAQPDTNDNDHYVYVCDFSDTFVIYCLNYEEFMQEDYTIDDDGNVTLGGSPIVVKPETTYVPTDADAKGLAPMEYRGMHSPLDRRAFEFRSGVIQFKSEPLTYHRYGRHSYFQDLVLREAGRASNDAIARLDSHAGQMRVLSGEREKRAWKEFRSGQFEYRAEPSPNDGQGGYFSPPAWLNELFATAKRPGRVISGLVPRFALPTGVSSINLPLINTGTIDQATAYNAGVPTQDFTDAAGSSFVATFAGDSDVALQLLEQSPQGAHLDWAIFQDLTEGYDSDLETQLLYGLGSNFQQLSGIVPASTITSTYTDGSPTGSEMWPFLAEAASSIGDSRELPPEVWLMRTARWFWLSGQESTSGYPFGISPVFLGQGDGTTPDPIAGIMGLPVFLNDAVSATLGGVGTASGTQDQVICFRPSDIVFLEGAPMTVVDTEVLSSSLGCRIQMHSYAAAITRYTSGIATVGGTGFVVVSGY